MREPQWPSVTFAQGLHDIAHANIHSCIASRGACTPFVANTTGLSTHTAALKGNFNENGLITFDSSVKLPKEQYTIIAHVRFRTRSASAGHSKPDTWDVAIGASRDISKKKGKVFFQSISCCTQISKTHDEMWFQISEHSWISTGVAAGLLIMFLYSFFYAAKTGAINLDTFLGTLYSHQVTLCADLIVGVGDTLAFTVCVIMVGPSPQSSAYIALAVFCVRGFGDFSTTCAGDCYRGRSRRGAAGSDLFQHLFDPRHELQFLLRHPAASGHVHAALPPRRICARARKEDCRKDHFQYQVCS